MDWKKMYTLLLQYKDVKVKSKHSYETNGKIIYNVAEDTQPFPSK